MLNFTIGCNKCNCIGISFLWIHKFKDLNNVTLNTYGETG